jgi:hypothetical protein
VSVVSYYCFVADIGDYDPDIHPADYVTVHKMLPKQCEGQEETVTELHKTLACVSVYISVIDDPFALVQVLILAKFCIMRDECSRGSSDVLTVLCDWSVLFTLKGTETIVNGNLGVTIRDNDRWN